MDREEFYRLKKVSGKKEKDKAAAEAEHDAKGRSGSDKENEGQSTTDVLGEQGDEDVIF
jgi:V-type H+-transporting ATPase subunit D